MRGHDLFVAIAYFLSKGNKTIEISSKEIEQHWSRTLLRKSYNSGYAIRARGAIHSIGPGKVVLTDEGISQVEHLLGLFSSTETTFKLFRNRNTHSIDRFLRDIFKKAAVSVELADTYVSGALFDTLLDEIPSNVAIRFAYGKDVGGFIARASRFAVQYNFQAKESKKFHDRFFIVDGRGYVIGPSLKDAADKKPAILIALSPEASTEIANLFKEIWNDSL